MNRDKIVELLETNVVLVCNVLNTGTKSLIEDAQELEKGGDYLANADARALRSYAKFQRDLAEKIMNATPEDRAELFVNEVVLIHNMLCDDAAEMEALISNLTDEEKSARGYEVLALRGYIEFRQNLAAKVLEAFYEGETHSFDVVD